MVEKITIDSVDIGCTYPPYIIAELSANHNHDISRAFSIIEEAKSAGANAIKLQTYRADTITMDCDSDEFKIKDGLWAGQTLYRLYDDAHMPWDWHQPLFKKAREIGITIFSSPFDMTAVDLLEDLNTPAYKIASFEVIDLPLISYAASTGKPLIISTGMANETEIAEAIEMARSSGCKELAILHCVSGYPSPASEYNLTTIKDMKKRFDAVVGISDHTMSNATAVAAVGMGACIIEKHVTLSRAGGGVDDTFSIEPKELKQLCSDSFIAWQSIGKVNYSKKQSEKTNIRFRRSLYVVKDIVKGEKLTKDNIRSIRPGFGLPPRMYNTVLGARATVNLKSGTALKSSHFK